MGTVAFDVAAFRARYPEFAASSDAFLTACFGEAGLYLTNGDGSPVQSLTRRALLLNMLTAHIAALSGGGTGSGAAPVGRVSSATEGSVSIATEFAAPGSAAWFAQTQYGIAYWQATLRWRSFRYIARATVPT